MITKLIFLITLIGINAFFAASEIALISLNDNKISNMAQEGNKKAKKLVKLLSEPSRFLATIQIGITLAGFLASAFAAESFADPIVGMLTKAGAPLSEAVLKSSTVVIITLLLSYFTLVFGELVPKRVAMKKSERIAFFSVTPLVILLKVASPFVTLLTNSTNFVASLFGIDAHPVEDEVTEEEIRMMVDIGEEKGAINRREKVMINNIFEFNNKNVLEIMTHRIELVAISSDIQLSALIRFIKDGEFSRFPVYEGSTDNIIGIIHIKDLLDLLDGHQEHDDFTIMDYIRKPYFTTTKKKIDELFIELQHSRSHMAVVLDEYGGTAGIVTMEDMIEEIVGHVFDEFDKVDRHEIIRIKEGVYEVKGTVSMIDLEKEIGLSLPVDQYETLNGFLIDLHGRIPSGGQDKKISYRKMIFEIKEVSEKRIERVVLHLKE